MKNVQCKRCFFFTPEWCPKKRDSLDPDFVRDCQYYRVMTNADRIRSMTDEELCDEYFRILNYELWKYTDSRQGLLHWMKQEAE